MIITIKNVLSPTTIQQVQGLLQNANFVDGQLSAGSSASAVKHNEELSLQSPLHQQLNSLVMAELVKHPQYQAAVLPVKVATAFYSRYSVGMSYGAHVDDAIMGPLSGRYRTDISSTLFLNSPDEYKGGELRIHDADGYKSIKLNAGDAVIYPSGSLHEVTEVSRGYRLVAVSWAQSLVKSNEQREVLCDLSTLRESLSASTNQTELLKLDQTYNKLLRMWSEL